MFTHLSLLSLFPCRPTLGMKALGDYIHSKGLKFGMYTAMGQQSCCGYPALGCQSVADCDQARRDVQTYVSWGIDYIKVDTCRSANGKRFTGSVNFNTTHPLVSSWFLEYGRLAGRPVLYHPSGISLRDDGPRPGVNPDGAVGKPHQFKLFARIANQWRAARDMQPEWSEVLSIIDYWAADNETTHPKLYPNEWEDWLSVSRPGVVQDPDALLVGNANDAASCRTCLDSDGADQHCPDRTNMDAPCMCCGSLTVVEEQSNMAMWAMWAAPLEIAADLRNISTASAAILRNPEVIAVNQDPLVYQARRVSNTAGLQVWQKRLVDDSVAVLLFNANDGAAAIPLAFEQVGFTGCDRVLVRDLIARQDLGVHTGELSVNGTTPQVAGHGVQMYNLTIVW